jgi:hypothetical protein
MVFDSLFDTPDMALFYTEGRPSTINLRSGRQLFNHCVEV